MTTIPLYHPFNDAVWRMADKFMPNGFRVTSDPKEAPSTFPEVRAYWERHNTVKVWTGASEETIFADPETNWAFRAWHDYCHASGNHDFSMEGETAVCRMQQAQLRQELGDTPEVQIMCNILEADIIGQKKAFMETGEFPVNQAAFDRAYLLDHFDLRL